MRKKVTNLVIVISLLGNIAVLSAIVLNWTDMRPLIVDRIKSNHILFSVANSVRSLFREEALEAQEATPKNVSANVEKLLVLVREEMQQLSSESERLDYLRTFVYTNSIHKGGADYAWDTPTVLSMLYEVCIDPSSERPELTCGSRTLALAMLLNRLNIPNRLVMIFSDYFSMVRSHTFLEVFNQETQRWEIQDPDKNLFYRHVNTSERASTAELVWGEVKYFVPCSSESVCGWEEHKLTRYIEHRRFGALMYDNRKHLEGQSATPSVILVNTDRFSPGKTFPENEDVTFIQFANTHYHNPIFVLNQQLK